MRISNLKDVSILDNMDYIDIFSVGSKEIAFLDQNRNVQNKDVVAQMLRQFEEVKYFYISEENEIVLLVFNNEIGLRIYGLETLKRFFNLLEKEEDLYDKFSSQIRKINRQQEKEALRETSSRVKRENRYTRNRAKAGLALVATIVIGTGVASYATRERGTAEPNERPQESSVYELPETSTETTMTELTNTPYFQDISDTSISYTEESSTYTTQTVLPEVEEKNCIELKYEDMQYDSKATICKENYFELITKYANMYGIDPKIMLGIATQERGTHSSVPDDSGAIGLMQLELSVWNVDDPNSELRAYNYETGTADVFNLPLPDMGNLDNNIRYACMQFQNCMKYMHNNPIAAIQCYNYGPGTTKRIIQQYCASTGKNYDEVLADIYNTEWLEFRCYEPTGDSEYVEKVLGFLGSENDFVMKDSNKNNIEFSIRAKQYSKTLS